MLLAIQRVSNLAFSRSGGDGAGRLRGAAQDSLDGDLQCAQGSVIRRSSLDAELNCAAARGNLTMCCNTEWRSSLFAWLAQYTGLRSTHGSVIRRPSLRAERQRGPSCEGGPGAPRRQLVRFVIQAWR